MESNSKYFDNEIRTEWAKGIGVAVIWLGVLGLLKSYIYYSWFGIGILKYTKWDEFILISIEDLSYTLVFFVIASFVPFLFFPKKYIVKSFSLKFQQRLFKSVYYALYATLSSGALMLLLAPYVFDKIIVSNNFRVYAIVIYWLAIFLGFGLPSLIYGVVTVEVLVFAYSILDSKIFNVWRIIITFCLYTLYVEYGSLTGQILGVEKGKYLGSIFKTEKTVYIIDKNNLYLGRTKDYLFIENKDKASVIVVPTVQIVEESIKSK